MFGRIFLCATLALFLSVAAQAQELPRTIGLDASGNLVWEDFQGNVLGPVETDPSGALSGVLLASTNEDDKLTASDGAFGDDFGRSVAIDGNHIIVGARFDDDNGSASGSVYIYEYDGVSWSETKLTWRPIAGGELGEILPVSMILAARTSTSMMARVGMKPS